MVTARAVTVEKSLQNGFFCAIDIYRPRKIDLEHLLASVTFPGGVMFSKCDKMSGTKFLSEPQNGRTSLTARCSDQKWTSHNYPQSLVVLSGLCFVPEETGLKLSMYIYVCVWF